VALAAQRHWRPGQGGPTAERDSNGRNGAAAMKRLEHTIPLSSPKAASSSANTVPTAPSSGSRTFLQLGSISTLCATPAGAPAVHQTVSGRAARREAKPAGRTDATPTIEPPKTVRTSCAVHSTVQELRDYNPRLPRAAGDLRIGAHRLCIDPEGHRRPLVSVGGEAARSPGEWTFVL
jgi:hypothetical protein